MSHPNETTATGPMPRRWLRRLVSAAFAVVAGLAAGASAAPVADDLPMLAGPLTDAQRQGVLAQIDAVGRRGFLYEVARPLPYLSAAAALIVLLLVMVRQGGRAGATFQG